MKKFLVFAAAAALATSLFAEGALAAKQTDADILLGSFRPAVHTKLCDQLKLGKDATRIMKNLKSIAMGKGEGGAKAEAEAILQALNQSKTNILEMATGMAETDPLAAAGLAQAASKTFPQDKKLYKPLLDKLLKDPAVATAWKDYQKLLAYKDGLPEDMAKCKQAYATVIKIETKCAMAKKMLGDRVPPAMEKLMAYVAELKAALEAKGCGSKGKK